MSIYNVVYQGQIFEALKVSPGYSRKADESAVFQLLNSGRVLEIDDLDQAPVWLRGDSGSGYADYNPLLGENIYLTPFLYQMVQGARDDDDIYFDFRDYNFFPKISEVAHQAANGVIQYSAEKLGHMKDKTKEYMDPVFDLASEKWQDLMGYKWEMEEEEEEPVSPVVSPGVDPGGFPAWEAETETKKTQTRDWRQPYVYDPSEVEWESTMGTPLNPRLSVMGWEWGKEVKDGTPAPKSNNGTLVLAAAAFFTFVFLADSK